MARSPSRKIKIPYESTDFPSSRTAIPASGELEVTWGEILNAALTIGRPNLAYVFKHGRASAYEAIFRISMIRMALERNNLTARRLRRTKAFKALDPTEKGAVGYFLGMTFCKLFSEKLLDTPWLLHLDVFNKQLNPKLLGGRSRPDFIGMESKTAKWHAFETKGRSSTPNAMHLQKAKDQANRLISVNGTACDLHVGAVTYFRNDVLYFYWQDPSPQAESVGLKLEPADWQHYYAPALGLLSYDDDLKIDGELPRPGIISQLDLKIEIHPAVLKPLRSANWMRARDTAIRLREELKEREFFPDGIKIITGKSWDIKSEGR